MHIDTDDAAAIRIGGFAALIATISFLVLILYIEQKGEQGKKLTYLKIIFGVFTAGPILYSLLFSLAVLVTLLAVAAVLAGTFFLLSISS
jgi:heme/copper-type cytochrome/quinol oxidase subunit 4